MADFRPGPRTLFQCRQQLAGKIAVQLPDPVGILAFRRHGDLPRVLVQRAYLRRTLHGRPYHAAFDLYPRFLTDTTSACAGRPYGIDMPEQEQGRAVQAIAPSRERVIAVVRALGDTCRSTIGARLYELGRELGKVVETLLIRGRCFPFHETFDVIRHAHDADAGSPVKASLVALVAAGFACGAGTWKMRTVAGGTRGNF